ncbi:MAG: HAD-IA family hydrolase [Patulibacter sp.]|nr:HAD-IA family hydrolase [Patulibacter sp.]
MTGASPIRALTLDAMGCLVTMRDPVPAIARLLDDRGTPRPDELIATALRREIVFYKAHHLQARDPQSLRTLQERAAGVLAAGLDLGSAVRRGSGAGSIEVDVDAAFVDGFLAALEFVPVSGVLEALGRLHASGVPMVCVSNWDSGLAAHLERLGIGRYLRGVVASGAVGVAKPDPRVFDVAIELLELPRDAIAHVGDEPVDRGGAAAAGLRFLPPPVATLPERLGVV